MEQHESATKTKHYYQKNMFQESLQQMRTRVPEADI